MPVDLLQERHHGSPEGADYEVQSSSRNNMREEVRAAAHLGNVEKCAEDCDCYQGNFGCSGLSFSKRKVDGEKTVGSAGKAAWPALAVEVHGKQIAGGRRKRLGAAEIECVLGGGYAGEGSDRAICDEAERDGEDSPEGYRRGSTIFRIF